MHVQLSSLTVFHLHKTAIHYVFPTRLLTEYAVNCYATLPHATCYLKHDVDKMTVDLVQASVATKSTGINILKIWSRHGASSVKEIFDNPCMITALSTIIYLLVVCIISVCWFHCITSHKRHSSSNMEHKNLHIELCLFTNYILINFKVKLLGAFACVRLIPDMYFCV